ncbi:NAD(P)/FAD-dependent oxidoreductase [Falsirhodobacter xinxiangensis]|uniref:NAD(P)/FAD-dependent oxidoreductase n=1 Tax=Falsirhodobacter xinxiangensis TaxID=2530049 RepID=UPI0010AA6816|nr:FAD-dependent oxidoreductase [Rhodobacter xinxiangensis]
MKVVVVGAGQAGVALAAKLRALGHDGTITLIGEEAVPPYQRPPLSKGYLLGDMGVDRLTLRGDAFFAENGIDLRLGAPVTALDRQARVVTVGNDAIPFDHLALTTGSVARVLPGAYPVRTLADVDRMRHEFAPGRRVLIVGGGYVGLEAAAVAAKLGLRVTLVEAAPRILNRVASERTAEFFRDLHRKHGVEIVEGAPVTEAQMAAADFVIAGIGIQPATALAEAAGLPIDNGIAADARGRVVDGIWAAGDCASFPWRGGRVRLESVQNAIDQAELVAANIMGAGREYSPVPWFWSDQYDVKLQIVGLGTGHDRVVERHSGTGLSLWYYRGAELLAVDAMNDPRAFMVAKRLLEAGRSPDPALIPDAADLKVLL